MKIQNIMTERKKQLTRSYAAANEGHYDYSMMALRISDIASEILTTAYLIFTAFDFAHCGCLYCFSYLDILVRSL